MRILILPLLLTACAPNHVGNPLTLPVRGITNAVQNSTYDARRARVSTLIGTNRSAIQTEARSNTVGPALTMLFTTARIPAQNQAPTIHDLAEISGPAPPSYWYLPEWPPTDWTERATVIAMVHSN